MKILYSAITAASLILLIACKEKKTPGYQEAIDKSTEPQQTDSLSVKAESSDLPALNSIADTVFVRLADYSDDFSYDLKYATNDNFLEKAVYDCAECYVRATTAKALIEANKEFMDRGYRIKFFDCYRPHDVQKKMWEIEPNPTYVADPAKGSIHNKGGAVDITLVDLQGNEIPMGTGFDFFGPEARHAYTDLPKEVIENRQMLKTVMESHGFNAITSEWWHYNYGPTLNMEVANFTWDCL
ncbi:M15 family metallopeptidase [Robertkochia aurantiaca]|uniref:M15 family metallopeptidase n=1 Tax=Robertkochia aurantiaca TaxID=2873700 RepID=UPI001CCCA19C|nr:M15 family metallopeptidase [Robertkochia sp. 3YJGBD-33]